MTIANFEKNMAKNRKAVIARQSRSNPVYKPCFFEFYLLDCRVGLCPPRNDGFPYYLITSALT
jgi:hypothetical protein